MNKLKVFVSALLTLALVLVTIKNWGTIDAGLQVLAGAPIGLLLGALFLLLLTFLLAALSYKLLALHTLSFRRLILVELAAAAVNRLLPAGLGGLGLNGWNLLRHKHSGAQATAVISTNNLLGIGMHILALCAMISLGYGSLPRQVAVHSGMFALSIFGALLVATAGLIFRTKIHRFLRNVWQSLLQYKKRPQQFGAAAATQLALTGCNVLILQLSLVAAQVNMRLSAVFMVYSLGVLLGSLTPTPGGIAGVEAGLAGGLVAYGAPLELAAAAVIAFRVVTFWLPIVPGGMALLWLQKQGLLKGARGHIMKTV